jgi:hypothetical protein
MRCAWFAQLEPLLPPLREIERDRPTSRDSKMQEFSQLWIKSVRRSLPSETRSRNITVFAPNDLGERTLVCRYIRAQQPPAKLRSERQLLRFVSLLPHLDDAALGLQLDVWATSRSFLELSAGDEEEHAILLCNFFLVGCLLYSIWVAWSLSHKYSPTPGCWYGDNPGAHNPGVPCHLAPPPHPLSCGIDSAHPWSGCWQAMGKQAYVLLGHGIPEGETSYVATRDSASQMSLWNAQSGQVYKSDDPACPLTSVGCVFNDLNVWANIQPYEKADELNWDFDDPKCWRPFFGVRGFEFPSALQSVQEERLQFKYTTDEYRSNVEREVEDRLQREFEHLRGHRVTDWNRSAGNKLKPLLRRYEEDASGEKPLSEAEHNIALERIRQTYHLVGFPINETYTDMRPLIDKLRATNIHLSDGPKMQFALAVYVHAYPNNVCSVWFYIASLEDLRAGGGCSSFE